MSTRAAAEKRVETLRGEIRRHEHLYYALNRPEISDQEYDALERELRELEGRFPDLVTPDSPTQRVGETPSEEFPSFAHRVPMLSLDNTYSEDELREFEERIFRIVDAREIVYTAELKVDGLSMALHYEGGRLVRAVTRGDGVRGDEVTANARAIRAVPLVLRDEARPAGERSRSGARSTCPDRASRRSTGSARRPARSPSPTPATPPPARIKSLDPRVVAGRGLDILLYSIADAAGGGGEEPVGGPRAHAGVGPQDQPGLAPVPRPRGGPGLLPRVADEEGHPRVRDRRGGGQGRRLRPPGGAGVHLQVPPVGHRLQVPGRAGLDPRALASTSRWAGPASSPRWRSSSR